MINTLKSENVLADAGVSFARISHKRTYDDLYCQLDQLQAGNALELCLWLTIADFIAWLKKGMGAVKRIWLYIELTYLQYFLRILWIAGSSGSLVGCDGLSQIQLS